MDVAYDMEFLEDGRTIELISIGMVAGDGRELYLIHREFDLGKLLGNDWLMANVAPSLPIAKDANTGLLHWNEFHPDAAVLTGLGKIAAKVHDFIQASAEQPDGDDEDGKDAALWGWYAAYDHVRLAQIWGPMISLPAGIPMWTHELKQLAEDHGDPDLPELPGRREHHALDDAREVMYRLDWLRKQAGT